MAKLINTAANVLGAAAAGASFLNSLNSPSPSNSKLTKFYASLRKQGIAKTNRFDVMFGIPSMLTSLYESGKTKEMLQLRCDSATVPGVTVATADVRRYGFGLSEKIPTGAAMSDFTCSFIADDEGLIYKFFYRWMTGIVKWDQKPSNGSAKGYNALLPYEFEYRKDYVVDLNIITYNENEDRLIGYVLYDAFPVSIGEIQYNWSDTDNLVRIPINFSYSYFKVDNIDGDVLFTANNVNPNALGIFGTLAKAGSAIQVLRSLKKPQSIGDVINVVNNAKTVVAGYGIRNY